MIKNLGKFTFEEDVVVTDPCYSLGIWCAAQLKIMPGEYNIEVDDVITEDDRRIWYITATHSKFIPSYWRILVKKLEWIAAKPVYLIYLIT